MRDVECGMNDLITHLTFHIPNHESLSTSYSLLSTVYCLLPTLFQARDRSDSRFA